MSACLSEQDAADFCARLGESQATACLASVKTPAGAGLASAPASPSAAEGDFKFMPEFAATRAFSRGARFNGVVYRAWKGGDGEHLVVLSSGDVWNLGDRGDVLPAPGDAVRFRPDLSGGWTMVIAKSKDAARAKPFSVAK
ncbi:MAG TPA: hypothetical protein DDZ68_14770 [Parvularcula sp.]|nr:hypothetical protein [Parvularcula sp.]HBS32558.1 hypothetical protein [Parvularcula sp.]HBS34638.1 hypothetical protein [Parvularcula sp.]